LSWKHPKPITGYLEALKLRFEDQDAKDEAYAALENDLYDGCIRDLITQIQMHNDKAMVSRAELNQIILDRFPYKTLGQMHTVNLTGKVVDKICKIIPNAGQTVETWDTAKTNLRIKMSIPEVWNETQNRSCFGKESWFDKPREFKLKCQCPNNRQMKQFGGTFKPRNMSNKTYAKPTEEIHKSELTGGKAAGKCQSSTWPGDRRGPHQTMDYFRGAKKEVGTAPVPKAKEK
jgi:hypothetical protein